MPGKKDNTRLVCDKLWEDTPRLKGQSASEGPQTSGSRGVDHIGEHKSREPGTPGIIEAIRETPVKYLKGIKGGPL